MKNQFNVLKDGEKKRLDDLKRFGVKIKHKIKIFNEIAYYLYVYLKLEQTLTFVAIRKDKNPLRITRMYQLDNLKLINTNGMDFVDYLLSNLKIYDEQIVFDTEKLVPLIEDSNFKKEVIVDNPNIKGNYFDIMKIKSNGIMEEINKSVKDGLGVFSPVVLENEEANSRIIHQKRDDINENQICVFNVYFMKKTVIIFIY